MIRPSEIRSATRDEMPHAVAAIVAAFLIDPAARFAWPAARDYLKAMPLAIHEFAGACFEHGTAYDADASAAALTESSIRCLCLTSQSTRTCASVASRRLHRTVTSTVRS